MFAAKSNPVDDEVTFDDVTISTFARHISAESTSFIPSHVLSSMKPPEYHEPKVEKLESTKPKVERSKPKVESSKPPTSYNKYFQTPQHGQDSGLRFG